MSSVQGCGRSHDCHIYIYCLSSNLKGKPNKTCSFSLVVINVELIFTEYNVSESEQIVLLHLVTNGTSEFDYIVTLTLIDISTGK